MRVAQYYVVLISDNAPTHAHPSSPPKNYQGLPPPSLTNMKLIYIDPNLTAYLQPLDAGIIANFKAAYRRKYASFLVARYNSNFNTSLEWKLNVLEAINLAVEAWDEIPAKTIFHCWQKTGIHPNIDRKDVGYYDSFLYNLHEATRTEVANLLTIYTTPSSTTPSPAEIEQVTNDYLLYDEDLTTTSGSTEAYTIDMSSHVKECIDAGLTTLTSLDNDLDSLYDDDLSSQAPQPIITSTTAISFLNELGYYLQALPVATLPAVLGSGSASEINISDCAKSLTYL